MHFLQVTSVSTKYTFSKNPVMSMCMLVWHSVWHFVFKMYVVEVHAVLSGIYRFIPDAVSQEPYSTYSWATSQRMRKKCNVYNVFSHYSRCKPCSAIDRKRASLGWSWSLYKNILRFIDRALSVLNRANYNDIWSLYILLPLLFFVPYNWYYRRKTQCTH